MRKPGFLARTFAALYAEQDAKSELAKKLDLGQYLPTGYHGLRWTEEQEQLLGTLPDAEVARRTGRTVEAVRIKREKMGLSNPESRAWTSEELSHLGTTTDAKVADRIGRTASPVAQKRIALSIPAALRAAGNGRACGAVGA